MRETRSRDYWFPALVLALLAIGLTTRIYGAWCLRNNLNPDAGVVALMVKHMAEGRDFPVFFYGQPYMGSFEPLVSAALCRIFGYSGFLVCMGTALLGLLTLPFIYRWARDLDSRAAGIAALAWCLVGPGGYFHYQVSPRGGYAATLFFGTVALWLGSRMIVRDRQGYPQAAPWYFLLGLLAGLGWWSNQLIAAALVTIALLFALILLARFFGRTASAYWRHIGIAGLGFLLGSLPFWLWNATHQWSSFAFTDSLGQRPVWDGLSLFFLERLPDLLDLDGAPWTELAVCGSFYLAAASITAAVLLGAGRKHRLAASVFGLMLFGFILVSALIFSTSHFAGMSTSRYLLPLVPAIAVMVGIMTARFQAWLPKPLAWAAWLPLLILIAFQYRAPLWMFNRMHGEESYRRQIESVGKFLGANDIEAAYMTYNTYAWNFALRETHCLSQLPIDRYPPYSRKAELADRIGIFSNVGGISEFLAAYGGGARYEKPAGVPILFAFTPPDMSLIELPAPAIARMVDSKGRDAKPMTTDRNLDTWWESASSDEEDEWVEIRFHRPERICLVRLLCFPEYPPELQVEGLDHGGTWRSLTPVIPANYYFWSGPRPYFGEWLYRLNLVFAPVSVEGLRLRRIGLKFGIRELQFFAPATEQSALETNSLPALVKLIGARGIDRLYCDRWVANAVHRTFGNAVQVPLDPTIFKQTDGRLDADMRLTPSTGILARREDADLCRDVLAQRLVTARETPTGPWILFDFDTARWSATYADDLGLQWSGFACFMERNKAWSATLVRRAELSHRNGKPEQALELLQQAARAMPDYHPVSDRMTWWLEAAGYKDKAASWRKQSLRLAWPETAAEIRFGNGLKFRGMTLSSRRVRPGEKLSIRYYWQYPTKPLRNQPSAFVHFQLAQLPKGEERGLFQDDHDLTRPASADYQPLPEIFTEERTIAVPKTLPTGTYSMRLGLFRPRSDGKRLSAQTDLPCADDAAILPVTLEVVRP